MLISKDEAVSIEIDGKILFVTMKDIVEAIKPFMPLTLTDSFYSGNTAPTHPDGVAMQEMAMAVIKLFKVGG